MSMLSCRVKNLYSFYSLNSRCRIKLFPTCQLWQKSGEKGFSLKLRIGALMQGVQVSSPPEKQEAALEKKPSLFKPRLKRCLTRQSRSLYSMTTSCPDRYPSTNSAWLMVTDVELGLKIMLLTWIVAMILRGRMSPSTRVEVASRDMSLLKGQTESSPASERQSAATMKWWSWAEQVAVTMQQGQVDTRSFLISLMTFSLASSFSIYYNQMDMDHPMVSKTMHMSIKWKWDISFVFESWTVLDDETGWIILGLALTILASILSVALPAVKNKVVTKLFRKKYNNSTLLIKERDTIVSENEDESDRPESMGEHIFGFLYILLYSTMHIMTMMLIMTYNGYVVIAVMVGLTLGYALFGMECDKDKNVPVNCCA